MGPFVRFSPWSSILQNKKKIPGKIRDNIEGKFNYLILQYIECNPSITGKPDYPETITD